MPLVQRRGQPHLLVHPDFEAKLQKAEGRLGRPIRLNDIKSPQGEYLAAWRSYAGAVYLWALWLAGKGSKASNPDSGPLTHLRGVGGDLLVWTADIIAALKWAGIQVNGVAGEPWHIQLANYLNYPIIKTHTSPAGNSGAPITGDDDDMLTQEEHDDIKEIRRMLGVLLGWPGAANAAEIAAANIPKDTVEIRRMVGGVLGYPVLTADENANLALLRGKNTAPTGTVAIDYAALAKAVNDDAARRLAN